MAAAELNGGGLLQNIAILSQTDRGEFSLHTSRAFKELIKTTIWFKRVIAPRDIVQLQESAPRAFRAWQAK